MYSISRKISGIAERDDYNDEAPGGTSLDRLII